MLEWNLQIIPLTSLFFKSYFQLGETWQMDNNKCNEYECEEIENMLVLVKVSRICPAFDPKDCKPVSFI